MADNADMPLQNRVMPTGEIVAVPNRGLMLGNRGCLHGQRRSLGVSRWRSKLWICCVLDWRDVRRDPMPPGRWTALFFLDEATALAAGHRPCGFCRRADFLRFAEAWRVACDLPRRPLAREMDAKLHAERVDRTRRQRTWFSPVSALPAGVMVRYEGVVGLVVDGQLVTWSFDGYCGSALSPGSAPVEVLTPPSIVAAVEAGYRPMVHTSAVPAGLGPDRGLRRQPARLERT